MRSWVVSPVGGPEHLRMVEVPKPSPKSGQLLVRVLAVSLNPADWKVLTGREGGGFIHSLKPPVRLGFDFSGEVEAVGAGVSGTRPGDPVFGFLPYSRRTIQGSLAEYVAVPEASTAVKPPGVSYAVAAAAATVGSTAFQALSLKFPVSQGSEVLINGASGGVGMFAVQLAHRLGGRVTGVCSKAKAEQVRSHGAETVLDYRNLSLPRIGRAFDLVFDVACNLSYPSCRRLLKPRGAYLTLLPSAGFVLGLVMALFSKRSCSMLQVQPRRSDLARLAGMLAAGDLQCPIDSTHRFEEVPGALSRFRGGETSGKIVIEA